MERKTFADMNFYTFPQTLLMVEWNDQTLFRDLHDDRFQTLDKLGRRDRGRNKINNFYCVLHFADTDESRFIAVPTSIIDSKAFQRHNGKLSALDV